MSAPRRSSLDIDGGPVIHGAAWGCWLVAVLVWAALTRNPWYLGVTLAWVAAVSWAAQRQPLLGRAAPLWSPWRFGLVVVPLAALFNALTVHVGSATLFRLPAAWPLIGGAYTVEALVYGALNGVALTVIFAAFTVVNRMVSLRAIVQLIPRTYYPVAVVAAIAITFVPVTLRQWQQIREAQAVRGHRLRSVRSWLPLWLPLLTGGLRQANDAKELLGREAKRSPLLLQAFGQFRHAIIKAGQGDAALIIVKISQDLRQNAVRIGRCHAIEARMQITIRGVDDHFLTAQPAQHGDNGGGLRVPHIGIADQADIRLQLFLVGVKESGQVDAA